MDARGIVAKAMEDGDLAAEELAALFEVPLFSDESGLILAAGRRKAELATDGKAEVHAQVGLNIGRCPRNCRFCSFAACNDVFQEEIELSVAQVVDGAVRAEAAGTNAIYLMITANYPMARFIETAADVRRALRPETPMVANGGDFGRPWANRLREAGFAGV